MQFLLFIYFSLFILERERKGEIENKRGGERKTSLCCFTYLCIHWLFLVCALTED